MDKYNRLIAIEEELEQEGILGAILSFTHSHTHIMATTISCIYIQKTSVFQCIVPLCLVRCWRNKTASVRSFRNIQLRKRL